MANRTAGLGATKGFKFAYTLHGGPPATDQVPLVSGTYYPGQVLRISATTGSATKAAAAGTSLAYVNAAYTTTADSGGLHPAYRLDDFNVFKAVMIASSTPQPYVGDQTDLAVSTNDFSLQGTASTNVFQIVGFPGEESTAAHGTCSYYVKAARSVWASTKSDVTT